MFHRQAACKGQYFVTASACPVLRNLPVDANWGH